MEQNRLGEIYVGDVGFILRRNPDTVRAPDLAFIRKERLPALEEEGFSTVVPDLAVEILSPSDRWTEVEAKIAEYFTAGVKAIWIVDPDGDEVRKTERSHALALSAREAAVGLSQSLQVSDAPSLRDHLDLPDASANLEIHLRRSAIRMPRRDGAKRRDFPRIRADRLPGDREPVGTGTLRPC